MTYNLQPDYTTVSELTTQDKAIDVIYGRKSSDGHLVPIAIDDTGHLLLGTGLTLNVSEITPVNIVQATAALLNATVDLSSIGGSAFSVGQSTSALSLSVVLASDQAAIPFTIAGLSSLNVTQATGTNLHTVVDNFPTPSAGPYLVNQDFVTPHISPNFNTFTPLGAGGIFTGAGEDVSMYVSADVTVISDQASTTDGLVFSWSQDNSLWDYELTFTLAPNVGQQFSLSARAKFFKITYTNGTTPQGVFQLSTTYYSVNRSTFVEQATTSLQITGNSLLSSIDSKLTSTASGLKVDGSGVTQPVSGSLGRSWTLNSTTDSVTIDGSISGGNNAASLTGSAIPTSADYLGFNVGGNLVGVSASNPLPITGSISTTNPSVGTVASAIPTFATTIGGTDGTNLRVAHVSASGLVSVDGSGVTQPVSGIFFQTTQPISGTVEVSGTVPVTGTFFQTTQPVSLAVAPTTPVTGTFWQATQPISGTVTANAGTGTFTVGQATGTNLHTVVDSGNVTATVSGTVAATQSGTWTNTVTQPTGTNLHTVVDNFPVTQSVSGTITANQGTSPWVVSGAVTTSGTATVTQATGTNLHVVVDSGAITASGTVAVSNFPATQPISGTIAVSNFPATQPVSIVTMPTTPVTGAFFQATQPVSGTVTANQGTSPWVVSGTVTSNIGTTGGLALDTTVGGLLTNTQLRASPVPVSGTVTANAGTGNFTVVQPTGTNLHVVLDSGTTVVTQPTAANLNATVVGTVSVSNFPSTGNKPYYWWDYTVNGATPPGTNILFDMGSTMQDVFISTNQPISIIFNDLSNTSIGLPACRFNFKNQYASKIYVTTTLSTNLQIYGNG